MKNTDIDTQNSYLTYQIIDHANQKYSESSEYTDLSRVFNDALKDIINKIISNNQQRLNEIVMLHKGSLPFANDLPLPAKPQGDIINSFKINILTKLVAIILDNFDNYSIELSVYNDSNQPDLYRLYDNYSLGHSIIELGSTSSLFKWSEYIGISTQKKYDIFDNIKLLAKENIDLIALAERDYADFSAE
ncbi:MAG: hypothetical protein AB8B67_02735 [Rickettsiaceae bacterium]